MKIKNPTLLKCFRGPGECDLCHTPVSRREAFHILAKGMGGGGQLDVRLNLLSVCPTGGGGNDCHYKYHFGGLDIDGKRQTQDDCMEIVALREQVSFDTVEQTLCALRRHDKYLPFPPELARFVDLELKIKPERGSAEWYTAQRIDPGFNQWAWHLWKPGMREPYAVHYGEHGASCECWDFLSRRDRKEPLGCKHIRSLWSAEVADA